jgi:hypothetical protein
VVFPDAIITYVDCPKQKRCIYIITYLYDIERFLVSLGLNDKCIFPQGIYLYLIIFSAGKGEQLAVQVPQNNTGDSVQPMISTNPGL